MHLRGWLLLSSIVFAHSAFAQSVSPLWGEHGEAWSSTSQLPDFSYAGFRSGNAPIPDLPVVANVKDYGAKGDGVADDTRALLAAIKGTESGAIVIPAGRYVLTDVLKLDRPNLVLRGAGIGKTVLVIPKSLQQLHPAGDVDGDKAAYAFSGGFVTMGGPERGEKLADVAAEARRGDRALVLSTVEGIKAGDFVRLQTNSDPTLGRYIHGDEADAGKATLEYKNFINWVARVTGVEGKTITLDRPLRIDLRAAWQPQVFSWRPAVENVGVEGITFKFAGVPKKPHLKEEGFNAVFFNGAANAWARDIAVIDCDVAFNVTNSRFCTVRNVTCWAEKRKNPTGHHALWARHSQDCLFDGFDIRTEYVHDLSVEGFACGNVLMNGKGVAINFDHHRNAPYENLFTNIDAGNQRRLWESSGRGDRGPHAAVRETFWNIRHGEGKVPKLPDWPQMVVVGVQGYSTDQAAGRQIAEPTVAEPTNLYDAQRRRGTIVP